MNPDQLNQFYKTKIADLRRKHDADMKLLQERLKYFEDKEASEEFIVSTDKLKILHEKKNSQTQLKYAIMCDTLKPILTSSSLFTLFLCAIQTNHKLFRVVTKK